MEVDVAGLVMVLVFYVVILVIGVWAARKAKREERKCSHGNKSEITIVGGRNISLFVGVFTMTATWVGGAYVLGTAEVVYRPGKGLLWALGPPAYLIAFFVGALYFAKPMRSKCYVTMMDPFQDRYGNAFSTSLLIPVFVSDIFWVACLLGGLGGTMSVILGLSSLYSILISAAVSISYTLMGGLYSVAYTDVIQLFFMFISLWLCLPFLLSNPISTGITVTAFYNQSDPASWISELKLEDAGRWVDEFMLLSFGALAYQAMYQRILSASSASHAQLTCCAAAVISFIMGIPSVIIGAVAVSTDWNATAYGLPSPFERGQAGKILPIVLKCLCPHWVSVLGIGAVAAAVMSSMDSALLSSASMFSRNIYQSTLRKQASDREVQWVIRLSILVVGLLGTGLAFVDESILVFWYLSSDLIYTVVFPQLVCVIHCRIANGYGATLGYFVGALLRLLSGEPLLGLPAAIRWPGWQGGEGGEGGTTVAQGFPFRTLAMLSSLATIWLGSELAQRAFTHGVLPARWDVFGVLAMEAAGEKERRREKEGERVKEGEEEKPPAVMDTLLGTETTC